jgi:hypothetical protein
MKHLKFTVYAIISFIFIIMACRKEDNFTTDPANKLRFSSDTLRFDTVFTSVGSATRYIKVFNPHKQPIRISKIALGNRTNTIFNLNIDGISGRSFTNVDIPAEDSIYVFAEVNINPNAPLSISPFVIAEDLIFETNGQSQKVIIEAWGQNANYIPNNAAKGAFTILNGSDPNRIIDWNDKKPYVVYGVLFVDSCILRIAAGTRIYVHGGISYLPDNSPYRDGIIYFLPNAKLESQGTLEKPVIIEGDRLEKEFIDESDQWAGIILTSRSNNIANYTTVKNSRVGIRVDSAANLTLNSCKIYNTAGSGLAASHATVTAENCLFYNNGGNAVQLDFGGVYNFTYCTMASFGTKNPSLSANNVKCYQRSDLGQCLLARAYPLSMTATNCIFYGSKEDEIDLLDATKDINTDFNLTFRNNIVRVKDLLKPDNTPNFLTNCVNCINADSKAKIFKKIASADYHLDSLSIAEMKALPIPTILKDIDGKSRDNQKPDIGCYEYQIK